MDLLGVSSTKMEHARKPTQFSQFEGGIWQIRCNRLRIFPCFLIYSGMEGVVIQKVATYFFLFLVINISSFENKNVDFNKW